MEEKAQGNFEILLIAVGVIVLAAAIGLYIKSAANSAVETANAVTENGNP
jgi:hypothetical protein